MPSIHPSAEPTAIGCPERFTLADARFQGRFARMALCALAVLAVLASLLGCGNDKVAGTSSGVDNPALTVSFRDAENGAFRITGDLDVFSSDQNPAVDPEPLVTIKLKNASFTNLTGDDFKRAAAASLARSTLSKSAASLSNSAAFVSAVTAFNLVLKTQDKNGGFVLGLRYDSAAKAFTRSGDSVIKTLSVTPKPLVRYVARIARDAVHGDAGRIFVPGSPFLATLVDSVFVIEDVPAGQFPMRLIAGDGKVYPIFDSLDTRDSARVYHPGTVPVGSIDSARPEDTIPFFSLETPPGLTVFLGEPVFLDAKLSGIPSDDPRVSVLWVWLREADSLGVLPADTARNPKDSVNPMVVTAPTAKIFAPTRLNTEVGFTGEGVYHFRVTATVGVKTAVDSITVLVRAPTPPTPRIINPQAFDSLPLGKAIDIQWEMEGKGPYTIEFSLDKGINWSFLVKQFTPKDALQTYPWTPGRELGASHICLIRITDDSNPNQVANMGGVFTLVP